MGPRLPRHAALALVNRTKKRCRAIPMSPRINITGQKFGRWMVIAHHGARLWLCRCDCGSQRLVSTRHLRKGHSQSCGCYKRERSSQLNSADLAGVRFGRLRAIRPMGSNKRYNAIWECVCDCGGIKRTTAHRLISGKTQSCGCLQKERTSTHGRSRTRLYRLWIKMRGRCSNRNSTSWPDYGGRGIKVCDRWQVFENFAHDM